MRALRLTRQSAPMSSWPVKPRVVGAVSGSEQVLSYDQSLFRCFPQASKLSSAVTCAKVELPGVPSEMTLTEPRWSVMMYCVVTGEVQLDVVAVQLRSP